jgi:hypothetical protein
MIPVPFINLKKNKLIIKIDSVFCLFVYYKFVTLFVLYEKNNSNYLKKKAQSRNGIWLFL